MPNREMNSEEVKIGVFKCGNIASSPLFEFLLDELADRKDIRTRTLTTGSKMRVSDIEEAWPRFLEFEPSLLVLISPNVSMQGPARVIEEMSESGKPSVVISDSPAKRVRAKLEEQGLGYMIITGDPLIGARREFLDPVEMAIFNSNIMKVLAIAGVYRMVHQEIDKVIRSIKTGSSVSLPRLVISSTTIRDRADFENPYARAKAIAAYELTEKVAEINFKACFQETESRKYIPLVASAHEIAQIAAKVAEEAREIEKYGNTLTRRPHSRKGETKIKKGLMALPRSEEGSANTPEKQHD